MIQQHHAAFMKTSALSLSHEYENLLPPLGTDDFEKLEKSINLDGIMYPIIINSANVVLDGHNRLKICKTLSIKEVPYIIRSFPTDYEEKEFVISFNLNRRHLTIHQKVELGLEIMKIEMIKAKQRQIKAGSNFGACHPKEELPPNMAEAQTEKGESIALAAKKVGLGHETLRKAQRICELAEKDDQAKKLWDDLAQGKSTIHHAYKQLSKPLPLSGVKDKFQVIVVTPPRYDFEELKKISLPIDEQNCIVWLWSSNRFLPSALSLISLWGLQFQTVLTWVKSKKGKCDWLLDQTEHCIVATKGSPSVNLTYQSTALIAAPPNERNSKPAEFYAILDSLCNGRKLDLFSPSRLSEKSIEVAD